MHFHFPSFLLGVLFGIVLIVLLIYLMLRSDKDEERLFNNQRLLMDSYPYSDEDHSPK